LIGNIVFNDTHTHTSLTEFIVLYTFVYTFLMMML